MDNIILQMKDGDEDEEKQVEAPAAIITNAITGGLFRSKPLFNSSSSLYSKQTIILLLTYNHHHI